MTLEQFNNKYKYQTDKERFNTSLDIWELANRIFEELLPNTITAKAMVQAVKIYRKIKT